MSEYSVLLTGTNGFLGKNIKKIIEKEATVISLGRSACEIICDLSVDTPNISRVDLIIHCAGKAHVVPKSRVEQELFYSINVQGTQNLLKSIKLGEVKPRAFIFISSVAVYGKTSAEFITEEEELLATDPYGSSKLQAEKLVLDWGKKNYVKIGILRLPLLVGDNPPGNLGDMIKGIKSGRYFRIGDGGARKSMVLAEDVAKIIPKLAEVGGIYNLTDGNHPSFRELDVAIQKKYGITKPIRSIPISLVKVLAWFGDVLELLVHKPMLINTNKLKKITSSLTFSDEKARRELGWNPTSVIEYYSKGSSEIVN
ncbi:MAG: NAD-dependent epimerase/dehydratase family protein [Spirosomataceae bacterium]